MARPPSHSDLPKIAERRRSLKEEIIYVIHKLTSPCFKQHSITHVANATEYDIWVLCDGDRKYINHMNANFQTVFGHAEVNYDSHIYYHANSVGFTRIKSGGVLPFELHHNGIIYITIKDHQYRTICDCFPVRHDQSVICGAGGYIHKAKYGHVWVDEQMSNHHPGNVERMQPSGIAKLEDSSENEKKEAVDQPVLAEV